LLIQVSAGKEDEVISKLKIYPDIEYAEKDGYYKVAEIPNDPWYYNQWSLLYHEDYYAVNLEPIWGKPTTPTPKPPPPQFPPAIDNSNLPWAYVGRLYFTTIVVTDKNKDKIKLGIEDIPLGLQKGLCINIPGFSSCLIYGITKKRGTFSIQVDAQDITNRITKKTFPGDNYQKISEVTTPNTRPASYDFIYHPKTPPNIKRPIIENVSNQSRMPTAK